MNPLIPFVDLSSDFKQHEAAYAKAFLAVGRSGQYILGQEVKKLESALAQQCQTPFAVAVGNGTDAISLVLALYGIKSGDEVICVPNTFIGTIGAIIQAGATPKFVDVDKDYNINPKLLDQAFTSQTKAIIAVHLTGNPAPMNELKAWAKKKGVLLIEDAAQALGAFHQGKAVGSLGDFATFSLHPLKILHGFGDGGFITTHSEAAYHKLLMIRNHGLKNRNEAKYWGVNSRLDELQAALIRPQLATLSNTLDEYKRIAQYYKQNLTKDLSLPIQRKDDSPVFHNFVIRTQLRNELMDYLSSKGIETKIHYPIPIHLMECARHLGYNNGSFPEAERQAKEILSLPIYPSLTDDQLNFICNQINQFFSSEATNIQHNAPVNKRHIEKAV